MKFFSAALSVLFASVLTASVALSQAAAPARIPIPATPGSTFDLAWVGKIVNISDPQFAPDGKSVAVVVSRSSFDDDQYLTELASVDVASGKVRYLTHDRKHAGFPRFSAVGDRMAFLAPDSEKHNQIFVLDMAGGDAMQLTHSPVSIQQFAWKPDGSAIAFAAIDESPKKTGADKFDDAFEVGDNDFLQTSKAQPTHLWLIPSTGGEAKRLTSGTWTLPVAFPPGPPASPIGFTPDGTHLVYERQENTYSGDASNSCPELLDLATGKSEPMTTHTKYASYAVVAPDGSHFAYMYLRDGKVKQSREVYAASSLKADGKNMTLGLDRNFYRAIWTPDSKAILAGANDEATASMWLVPLEGKPTRLNLGNVTPATGFWLSAAVGPQGQIAFTGTEAQHPSELYVLDSATAKARRLTDFNAAFDSLALGKTEVIRWEGPDKWMEDGVITYPPHYTAGKKLPLVLYIHGGPNSSSKDTFSTFAQIIAAQGWLVFEPNYRGSDNMGNAFFTAIIDDAGDGPGRDVFSGMEVLKKRGLVDESNMAVTGWSYGGYMTTWLLGHASYWKAAIAGAPVTNWLDQYNYADGNVNVGNSFGGPPTSGELMKHYIAQSPITYATKMKTPTLILQDTGDYRVPITEGYQLYHALKDQGVVTQFYAYPVAGHSPADPVRMRDVYRRWIEWLHCYLPSE